MSVIKSERVDKNQYELEIAVDAEAFAAATDRAYKKEVKKIQVPGFRKGKAPRHLIEKMYGEGVFFEDAVDELYPGAYMSAIEELKLEPVDNPQVEVLRVSKEEGFAFKATVTVKPEVTVKDYKGIAVTRPSTKVSAEDVDAEINRMADRNARLVDVDDRAAVLGDTAVIDFEGFVDGKAFEGGKGENHELVLGSGQFIEGFEDQIVGHKIGDEFDVNVTFPDPYQAEELAGKPAVFKCKLNQLKRKELPVIDDEFAKDLGDYDTLADLKASVEKRLTESREHSAEHAVENALIDNVVANMEADIPACMIEHKIDEMVQDFGFRLSQQGISMEMYCQYTGTTPEGFRDTFRAQAEKQVKVRLALEKIVELEGITVPEDELNAQYDKLAEQYKMDVAQIKAAISPKDMEQDMCVNKAIELIQSSAVITDEEPAEKPAEEKPAE